MKQQIIEQTMSHFQNYLENEIQRNQLGIQQLQSAFIGKIAILEDKMEHLNRFNIFLQQVKICPNIYFILKR